MYDELEGTNFPTLYASTHPADDWAESFAGYVHSVLLGKPFEIRIYRGKKLIKAYGSCWEAPRCAEKRKYIERFLGTK